MVRKKEIMIQMLKASVLYESFSVSVGFVMTVKKMIMMATGAMMKLRICVF
jgi:hypothetical protein